MGWPKISVSTRTSSRRRGMKSSRVRWGLRGIALPFGVAKTLRYSFRANSPDDPTKPEHQFSAVVLPVPYDGIDTLPVLLAASASTVAALHERTSLRYRQWMMCPLNGNRP